MSLVQVELSNNITVRDGMCEAICEGVDIKYDRLAEKIATNRTKYTGLVQRWYQSGQIS